ncbi:MAG: DASH family cryptochrome [Planctomycetota bacterium]
MNRELNRPTLLWFRRGLRVHDQPMFEGLAGPALGVWVLDPRELLITNALGFPRCGDRRLKFLLESVADLRAQLRGLGSELLVRLGEPESVLPKLMRETRANRLRAVEEPGTEERAVEKRLRRAFAEDASLGEFDLLPVEALFEMDDDPRAAARELPEVFSKWRRKAEKHLEFALPDAMPTSGRLGGWPVEVKARDLPTLTSLGRAEPAYDPRGVLPFVGGESAGLQRLRQWVFAGDHLRGYKETRNGMLGEAYSSKFSPWLALGCLSPRLVVQETLRYESERTANDSTYWLRFELLWREFFRLYLLKHGAKLFRREGPADRPLDYANRPQHFEAWTSGGTGVPMVDANLRELAATGFMSNRGRQNVASFLAKNLDVDWRWGARWFESQLLDYDVASNWGNWAYAAGVGADPRGFRGFDVIGQGKRYDEQGAYVRHWLSDESSPNGRHPHEPWKDGGPNPIVDVRRSLADAEARWGQAAPGH